MKEEVTHRPQHHAARVTGGTWQQWDTLTASRGGSWPRANSQNFPRHRAQPRAAGPGEDCTQTPTPSTAASARTGKCDGEHRAACSQKATSLWFAHRGWSPVRLHKLLAQAFWTVHRGSRKGEKLCLERTRNNSGKRRSDRERHKIQTEMNGLSARR